mgnify:CR=1 FL=1
MHWSVVASLLRQKNPSRATKLVKIHQILQKAHRRLFCVGAIRSQPLRTGEGENGKRIGLVFFSHDHLQRIRPSGVAIVRDQNNLLVLADPPQFGIVRTAIKAQFLKRGHRRCCPPGV